MGVMAQNVHATAPEAVRTGPDGIMKVAYGNLTALLIEAVHSLDARLAAAERRLADLV